MDAPKIQFPAGLSPQQQAEIQAVPYRSLEHVDLEILFMDGQVCVHYKDVQGKHKIKFIDPAQLRSTFNELPIDSGWLPPGVIRYGMNHGPWMVHFIPPQVHTLSVDMTGLIDDKTTKVQSLSVPLPGLVSLIQIGTRHHLWAIAEAEFNPQCKLYRVPLPNIDDKGQVCSEHKGQDAPWRFLSSVFTDHLKQGKCKGFKEDIRRQLLRLHTTQAQEYPAGDLLAIKEKADTLIEAVLTRHPLI